MMHARVHHRKRLTSLAFLQVTQYQDVIESPELPSAAARSGALVVSLAGSSRVEFQTLLYH